MRERAFCFWGGDIAHESASKNFLMRIWDRARVYAVCGRRQLRRPYEPSGGRRREDDDVLKFVFAGLLGLSVLTTRSSAAEVLTNQDALNKAWADELLITTENMTPSWIAQTHRFIYGRAVDKRWTLIDFDVDTGRGTSLGEGRGASVSPDGHHVLFLAPNEAASGNALWMM